MGGQGRRGVPWARSKEAQAGQWAPLLRPPTPFCRTSLFHAQTSSTSFVRCIPEYWYFLMLLSLVSIGNFYFLVLNTTDFCILTFAWPCWIPVLSVISFGFRTRWVQMLTVAVFLSISYVPSSPPCVLAGQTSAWSWAFLSGSGPQGNSYCIAVDEMFALVFCLFLEVLFSKSVLWLSVPRFLWSFFFHECMLNFIKCFFYLCWDDNFFLVNVVITVI